MKLGPILAALSPGLSATGMFGDGAQGAAVGGLSALSPILAMLLKKKKDKKGEKEATSDPSALEAAGQAAIKRPAISMPAPPPIMNPSYGPMGAGMTRPQLNGMMPQGMPPGLYGR